MTDQALSEESIFLRALEIPAEADRRAFLDRVCGDNSELLAGVDRLLRAHRKSGDLLDLPDPLEATGGIGAEPGTAIGPYKLLEQIGEGGMGVVFMAEQTEPLQRTVALKIIKPGMDTRQVIARFEAERQALALMDHPNIAKVLDAGTTDTGRPYFVMELVEGVPITQYCDQQRLPIRQRLDLMSTVSQAVQHAHQKGIIHRDLKPSNVLVAEYDGKPVPKVIDFGVAKATAQRLTERTMFTEYGQLVGTFEYMSPEQARFNQLDVDTRSDIYSLGVLLYELLAGSPPLQKEQLRLAAFDEILRLIGEEEPPKPSARLSSSQALPSISAQRQIEPAKLKNLVRGELDWIVMKCLEKDRNRRYESASGFAMDLQHYLNDEPVLACPPSTVYRFRKLARRYRDPLIAASLVFVTLVCGIAVSSWQAVRATQAENLAETRLKAEIAARNEAVAARAAEVVQRREAEANFEKARQAVDEYYTLVSESTLFDIPGLQPLRRDLLEAALRFYKQSANQRSSDAEVQAELAVTYLRVAEVYHATDRNDDSILAIGQALDVIDRLLREHPTTTRAHQKLAGFWKGLRRTNPGTALPRNTQQAFETLLRLAATWERLAQENGTIPAFRSDLAAMNMHIGDLQASAGQTSASLPYFRKAKAILEQLVRDEPQVRQYREDLAWSCEYLARKSPPHEQSQDVEDLWSRSIQLREQLVAQSPQTPLHRYELTNSLRNLGLHTLKQQPQVAEQALRRAIELSQSLTLDYPKDFRYRMGLVHSHEYLGDALRESNRSEEGKEQNRRALDVARKAASDFPDDLAAQTSVGHRARILGFALQDYDDSEECIAAFREGAEVFRRLAAEHPADVSHRTFLASTLSQLARRLSIAGNSPEAVITARQCLSVYQTLLNEFPETIEYRTKTSWAIYELALLLADDGNWEQAEHQVRELISAIPEQVHAHIGLARILAGQHKIDEAKAVIQTVSQKDFAETHANVSLAWYLANCEPTELRDSSLAIKLAHKAVQLAPEDEDARRALGVAQYRAGNWLASLDELKKSAELRHGGDSTDWFYMAMADWKLGHKDRARQSYDKAMAWMDKNQPKYQRLQRTRAEVAELLGITGSQQSTDATHSNENESPKDSDSTTVPTPTTNSEP